MNRIEQVIQELIIGVDNQQPEGRSCWIHRKIMVKFH